MDRSTLRILRHAPEYERDRRMFARLPRSHTILIYEHHWPFVPTGGDDRWRHWLRAALLLGLRLTPHILDWGTGMVGALSRFGGSIAEWVSAPLGSKAQARST